LNREIHELGMNFLLTHNRRSADGNVSFRQRCMFGDQRARYLGSRESRGGRCSGAASGAVRPALNLRIPAAYERIETLDE
jgi:hypothetical protein